MRALSILQPWAWLIVNGHKDVENRTWRTRYRGEFLVHAGKGFDDDYYDDLAEDMADEGIILPPKADLPRGGIVGSAVLVDCVDWSASRWFNGAYGFVLRDGKPCTFVPCRGMLNFFTPPAVPVDGAKSWR